MLVGAGVQGPSNWNLLDQIFGGYLILGPDWGMIEKREGIEHWFRPMHTVHIDSPAQDAAAVVMQCLAPYHRGVRTICYPNEWLAIEGDPATPQNYQRFCDWGVQFVNTLRDSLQVSGMGDMRIFSPSLSPGHQEDDGFEGYRILAPFLSLVDGVSTHHYWTPFNGWLTDDDAEWWSRRVERVHALLSEIGLGDKPIAVTEHNRKVDRGSPADVANYVQQVREYNNYLAGLGYVEAAFTFLATNQDTAFDDLTLEKMPGALESLVGLKDQVGEGTPVPPLPPPDGGGDMPIFEGSFEEERVRRKGKWTPYNRAAVDDLGNWTQDFHDDRYDRWGILREYADEPGKAYLYWSAKPASMTG